MHPAKEPFEKDLAAMLGALEPSAALAAIEPITGDASTRSYYRIHTTSPSNQSFILMVMDPKSALQSEEGTSSAPRTELPFLNVQRFLKSIDWPVPRIYAYRQDAGMMLLEDFGDTPLEAFLVGCETEERRRIYREALELLVSLQIDGTRALSSSCEASQEFFDIELLYWELEHYYEYGIVARHGTPAPADSAIILSSFREMAQQLANLPKVLVHRDYHSRNLMVREKGLGIIDFQDALMGPREYDLASLLRDSYVALPEEEIDLLLEYYLGLSQEGSSEPQPTAAAFRQTFDLMSIQRNLKAAGRFVYIDKVKQNPAFLRYIPHTLENVRKNLLRYASMGPLLRALARSEPAFRAG